MSTDSNLPKLTPKQIRALVVLMVEARQLNNNDLRMLAGDAPTGKDHAPLVTHGLVETDKSKTPFAHILTDKGWRVARQIHTMPAPSGSATATLFTVLANIHRALDRLGISHAEFFKQGAPQAVAERPAEPIDVEAAVRAAYAQLTPEPNAWVDLADLRDRLGAFRRDTVDEALLVMVRKPGVRIIPIADAKNVKERDKKAALRIGVQDNHVIAIEG